MSSITDFHHAKDSSFVGWVYSGKIIKKSFDTKIHALLLRNKNRVLIIERKNEKNNAIIFNGDGSEFKRITNPDSGALCFGDLYYVLDELTLISRRRDASMLAVIIDENGNVLHTREAR